MPTQGSKHDKPVRSATIKDRPGASTRRCTHRRNDRLVLTKNQDKTHNTQDDGGTKSSKQRPFKASPAAAAGAAWQPGWAAAHRGHRHRAAAWVAGAQSSRPIRRQTPAETDRHTTQRSSTRSFPFSRRRAHSHTLPCHVPTTSVGASLNP